MERDGWDHTKNGLWVKGITTIRVVRGMKLGTAQIRVLEGGSMDMKKIKLLKNDRYDYEQGKERNPMG
jgi:hypothetical protein